MENKEKTMKGGGERKRALIVTRCVIVVVIERRLYDSKIVREGAAVNIGECN
jgi:hypothetical protein